MTTTYSVLVVVRIGDGAVDPVGSGIGDGEGFVGVGGIVRLDGGAEGEDSWTGRGGRLTEGMRGQAGRACGGEGKGKEGERCNKLSRSR